MNLITLYKAYSFFLRQGNIDAARHAAKAYNRLLTKLGGQRANPTHYYLSMGRGIK